MNILEKEIEDVIYELIEEKPDELIFRGLDVRTDMRYRRQFDVGSYGIADMVGYRLYKGRMAEVVIYELKKDNVTFKTFSQALGYAKGIEQMYKDFDIMFSFVLIGKRLDMSDSLCYAPDFINNLSIYTYSIDLSKGIRFNKEHRYVQSRHSFPNRQKYSVKQLKEFLNG